MSSERVKNISIVIIKVDVYILDCFAPTAYYLYVYIFYISVFYSFFKIMLDILV